jgi:hypothetical protein
MTVDSRRITLTTLGACERSIENGLQMMETGAQRILLVLGTIHSRELFRQASCSALDDYLDQKWGRDQPSDYQLINARIIINVLAQRLSHPPLPASDEDL